MVRPLRIEFADADGWSTLLKDQPYCQPDREGTSEDLTQYLTGIHPRMARRGLGQTARARLACVYQGTGAVLIFSEYRHV